MERDGDVGGRMQLAKWGGIYDTSGVEAAYKRATEYLRMQGEYSHELLESAPMRAFKDEVKALFHEAISRGLGRLSGGEPSPELIQGLQNSAGVFSGMKAFHEMVETSHALFDENGNLRPREEAWAAVQKINQTYNRNYFNAEYGYASLSAEAAGKWEDISGDEDDYLLQYRTQGDDRVRDEHAALEGITLPASDPFWGKFYPPNGWNCRCYVVKVPRDKYPESSSGEAAVRGKQATEGKYADMFRFNPGKEAKLFNDYNPYTRQDCTDCLAKIELAARIPANQLCQGCKIVRSMQAEWNRKAAMTLKEADVEVKKWFKEHAPTRTVISDALETGEMRLTRNSVASFLWHARSSESKWVLTTLADNADALEHISYSPLGETKDMSSEKDRKNVAEKAKRNVVGYNLYKYCCNGKRWKIGMECIEKGKKKLEQPYFIKKEKK